MRLGGDDLGGGAREHSRSDQVVFTGRLSNGFLKGIVPGRGTKSEGLMLHVSINQNHSTVEDLVKQVSDSNEPILIEGEAGKAVLVSEKDWNVLQEKLRERAEESRADRIAKAAAFARSAKRLQALMAERGITEEEVVNEFERRRKEHSS